MSCIGIATASLRRKNNGFGIAAWVRSIVDKHPSRTQTAHTTFTINSTNSPYPLGPVFDPVVPSNICDPANYAEANTREWSRLISSFSGLIVVSSEYNGGCPGELKNAFDHLYHEWNGKPVLLVTYGSHGGGRCAAQLKPLFERSFKMRLVGDVQINLPREFIGGERRVNEADAGQEAEFLREYAGQMDDGVGRLLQAVAESEAKAT